MHYCTECRSLEGCVSESEDTESGLVCEECGSEDSIISIPEHDDYDTER